MLQFSLAEMEQSMQLALAGGLGYVCATQPTLGTGCCGSSAGPAWRMLPVQARALGEQKAHISWDASQQVLAILFLT